MEYRIEQLRSLLDDHNAMKHELETTKRRLKASDLLVLILKNICIYKTNFSYQMVVKNKGPNEADVDSYIDKYSTANGDPSVGALLKVTRT
jgi:hypothetical protein